MPRHPIARTLLGLAAVQLLLQTVLLARGGVAYAVTSLSIDDTYYYLQTAWNAARNGFISFDGLHPTNGVQLLWFFSTVVLAALAPSKTALLFTALVVCFVLNVLCYVPIWKLAQRFGEPLLALVIAGLWSVQTLGTPTYSTGMENSLHGLVFFCALWQLAECFARAESGKPPNPWPLALLLILNAWARLDSALFSAVFYLASLWAAFRAQAPLRAVLASGVLLAAGFGAELLTFRALDGAFLPVSALIKTANADPSGAGFLGRFGSALHKSLPAGGMAWCYPALCGVLLLGGRRLRQRRAFDPGMKILVRVWTTLLCAFVLYHLVIAASGAGYESYFVWYRSPLFIFWYLTAALLTALLLELELSPRGAAFRTWGVAAFGLLAFAFSVQRVIAKTDLDKVNIYTMRYQTARWIAEHSPPDTRYAAWNAGQIGYFSDRCVINLDGLINSVQYFREVLQPGAPVERYLQQKRVSFVVDYHEEPFQAQLKVVYASPKERNEAGRERQIRIWSVVPEAALVGARDEGS